MSGAGSWPDDQPATADLVEPIGHDPALEPTPIYDQLRLEMWPPEET